MLRDDKVCPCCGATVSSEAEQMKRLRRWRRRPFIVLAVVAVVGVVGIAVSVAGYREPSTTLFLSGAAAAMTATFMHMPTSSGVVGQGS